MRAVRAMLPAAVALLAGAAPAATIALAPEQKAVLLGEAQRAFDRGAEIRPSQPVEADAAFREAADKFQILVDSGVHNGRLYYNLANACLESGQLGRAIANYRRAERLLPGDGRVEHNLGYARSLCRDQIEPASRQAFLRTLLFWHYGTSLRTRWGLAVGAYVLFWLLMTASLWVRRWRWRTALVPLLAVWLVLGCSVGAQWVTEANRLEGVLVVDEVVVRKGNGEGFEPQFRQKLHEGVEFVVLERRHDWLLIELPDGKSGWIRVNQGELI